MIDCKHGLDRGTCELQYNKSIVSPVKFHNISRRMVIRYYK